jgi:hypothetical protein
MVISPFHRLLHAWAFANIGTPLLHVDIHGKMDRKENYDLDLGISCMYKNFISKRGPYDEIVFVNTFVEALTLAFNKALGPIPKHRDYKAVCNSDPYLNGNWGLTLKTMTDQASDMGIPSF